MIRLIYSIVLLVVLAVLVVFNARYTTTFSLFGRGFEEVPVIAVALVSFVLGVIYSFVFYVLRFLDKRRRVKLKQRGEQVRTRERELQERASRRDAQATAVEGAAVEPGPPPSRRRRKKSS